MPNSLNMFEGLGGKCLILPFFFLILPFFYLEETSENAAPRNAMGKKKRRLAPIQSTEQERVPMEQGPAGTIRKRSRHMTQRGHKATP